MPRVFSLSCVVLTLFLGGCDDDYPFRRANKISADAATRDAAPDAQPDAGRDAGSETMGGGCNPIGDGIDCLLPFPSDNFLVDAAETRTGKKVLIREEARVQSGDFSLDIAELYEPDGFSVGSQILFAFAEPIDEEQLVNRRDDFAESRETASPTLLIEADTGELVAHFAEIDARDKLGTPMAFIRPASRLKYETRYIVAVHGLRTESGPLADPSSAFEMIRDDSPDADKSLTSRYETDIFPVIETAGVERSDIQLAWEFTTGSAEAPKARMLAMRDTMHTWLAENDPVVTIVNSTEDDNPNVATRIEGTIRVPAFVDSADPGARLLPEPKLDEPFEVPFVALIPPSVAEGRIEGRALQFGHGFFYNVQEIESRFNTSFAEQYGFVQFAVDWWGMTRVDQEVIVGDITSNISNTLSFVDRVHQGMANQLALTRAIKTSLAKEGAFRRESAPTYATDDVYFYGISQGHILGSTLLSISDELNHGALGVGGANLSLIMSRSSSFAPFIAIVGLSLKTSRNSQKFAALVQLHLDMIDPMTYADEFRARLDQEQSPLRAVFQMGIGDTNVPNIGMEFQMRTLGVPTLAPFDYTFYDQQTVEAPVDSAALTLFDFGVDPLPGDRALSPAMDTPVHNDLRRTTSSQEQISRLFRPDGKIEQTCDGVCDPE